MNIISWLLDLLYPPRCTFCQKLLQKDETNICNRCRRELPIIERPIKRGRFFSECYAVASYADKVAESLKRYKFYGMQQYAGTYGELLAMCLLRENAVFDIITWVPISKKRRRKRGFDQSFLLAEAVAKELNAPCIASLRKVRDNRAQSSLRGVEVRQANVINSYSAVNAELFANRRVLLIDDIITTGATLSECSRVLLTAGAASVVCATLAATQLSE